MQSLGDLVGKLSKLLHLVEWYVVHEWYVIARKLDGHGGGDGLE